MNKKKYKKLVFPKEMLNNKDYFKLLYTSIRDNGYIYIDKNIYKVCKLLLNNNIKILNSCDGHSYVIPTIIIDEDYTELDVKRILLLIRSIEKKPIAVLKWNDNQLIWYLLNCSEELYCMKHVKKFNGKEV